MTTDRVLYIAGGIVALAASIALCSSTLGPFFSHNADNYFAQALKEVRAHERVMIDGVAYTVRDGAVMTEAADSAVDDARALRLAYAKLLATYSPPIALAGTDPDALELAVRDLRAIQERLALIQPTTDDEAFVREGLYPIAFLESAARLERARLAFIESGSDTDFSRYRAALYEAADTYESGIARFRIAFTSAVPRTAPDYAGTDVVMSRASVLAQLDQLEEGMRRTQHLIGQRDRCIAGITAFCSPSDIRAAQFPDSESSAAPLASVIRDVRNLFAEAGGMTAITDGPVYTLSDPACAAQPGTTPAFVLFKYASPVDLPPYERIYDVSDARFTRSEPYRALPFFEYFSTRGISYVHNPWFTYYKCLRIGSDYGTILAMRRVREAALGAAPQTDAPADMREAARALGRAAVDESDVRTYLRLMRSMPRGEAVSTPTPSQIEGLTLALLNRSADFDRAIQLIVHTEDINIRLSTQGLPVDLDAPYLFLVRSGFFLLFLGDNPSVAGTQQIAMKSSAGLSADIPFVYYASLRDQDARAEIFHDLAFDLSMHHSPNSPTSADCDACTR